MPTNSVRIVVADDDLHRSRLTVFFRLLLALPHLVWLALWTYVAPLAGFAAWIGALATGTPPRPLHAFLARYVRYTTHVFAFVTLAANPFPGFTGRAGSYPVEVEIGPPERQSRWTIGFRFLLAWPAMWLAAVLRGTYAGFAPTIAFLAWFVALVRGRMPQGFRDAVVYALGYAAQVDGYLYLLTGGYPSSDPALAPAPPERLPVAIAVADDERRSRLTVFFRALLALPHLVWLSLWGYTLGVVVVVNWFATLVRGTPPRALHRFTCAYVRYQAHVLAFLFLVANPFPGFTGRAGSYPVDVELPPAARQSRWITGFRLLLAIPATVVAAALAYAALLAAFLGWFAALATGRMPRGLRNLGAWYLRYAAHVGAYQYLVTDRYPYSGPVTGA